MKNFLMKTVVCILKALYFPMKRFPKQDKIVFISRQSNSVPLDFKLIISVLGNAAPHKKIVVLPKKLEGNLFHKAGYGVHMIRQMYHIATAELVVLDGYCIAASVLNHPEGTKIVQLWHALGAVKKFGYQALGTMEGSSPDVARIMKMHKNYDRVVCASWATAQFFSEAFHTPLSKFRILGMPRVDYIQHTDNKNAEILREYPYLNGKETILYIPTFRKEHPIQTESLIAEMDHNRYNLIVKKHPLDTATIDEKFLLPKKYGTYDLLKFADYIITDYSAAAIEASILNKPIFFYVYDYDYYQKSRGFNIDVFQEMPEMTSKNAGEIVQWIEAGDYNYGRLDCFREKYVETLDFCNTERITEELLTLAKES